MRDPLCRAVAYKILNRIRINYKLDPSYAEVDCRAFPHISKDFYETTQRSLEKMGFHLAGDVESDLLKRQTPNPRTFLRLMISSDGCTDAAITHLSPAFLWRVVLFFVGLRRTKLVEFQSELENGDQVSTTPIRQSSLLPCSPKIHRRCLPLEKSWESLYHQHLVHLDEVKKQTGCPARCHKNLTDIASFELSQARIQREYLKSIGWITKEYLLRNGAGNEKAAQRIYDAIQQILAEEKQQGFDR
jgi:hypothetical protein